MIFCIVSSYSLTKSLNIVEGYDLCHLPTVEPLLHGAATPEDVKRNAALLQAGFVAREDVGGCMFQVYARLTDFVDSTHSFVKSGRRR